MSAVLDVDALADALAEKLAERTQPRLVDAATAAQQLGVPPTWLATEARAGRAPCRKLGKYVRYDLAELRVWADSHAHGPRGGAR